MSILKKVSASFNRALDFVFGNGVKTASEKFKEKYPTCTFMC